MPAFIWLCVSSVHADTFSLRVSWEVVPETDEQLPVGPGRFTGEVLGSDAGHSDEHGEARIKRDDGTTPTRQLHLLNLADVSSAVSGQPLSALRSFARQEHAWTATRATVRDPP
ncbi:MAG: hypothetical protein HY901_18290 [Deltaproteobacteria bacterium]|nr:hypothetical protein [Deltaproteobacteria bacterium]